MRKTPAVRVPGERSCFWRSLPSRGGDGGGRGWAPLRGCSRCRRQAGPSGSPGSRSVLPGGGTDYIPEAATDRVRPRPCPGTARSARNGSTRPAPEPLGSQDIIFFSFSIYLHSCFFSVLLPELSSLHYLKRLVFAKISALVIFSSLSHSFDGTFWLMTHT